MADTAEMQAKLSEIRDAYAAKLPDKLTHLMLAYGQLSRTEWDDDGFQALYRMVHSLSGSGKTFGFSALSDAAREMESFLRPILEAKIILNNEQHAHLLGLIDEVRQTSLQIDKATAGQSSLNVVSPYIHSTRVSRNVFIVENDQELAHDLEAQLSYYGFDTTVFHVLNDFLDSVRKNPSAIVLMDVNFLKDEFGSIRVMNELQQGRDVPITVIFISSQSSLEFRLEAARAGGVAYLDKPVDFAALVDILDDLTTTQEAPAYRIMIVDDDISLTQYYQIVLEQAGMLVEVVNDPLQVLKPLFEFTPDLILIDMYMPGCNGMELSKVIRQINAFVSIPIVFLSAERNLDKQNVAVSMGADDFLTKPIEGQHLVSAVTNRIKRSMLLRSFMIRDSLTGLLNHTTIKEQLAHEMVRSKRQGKPLSFAMIDIDFFKRVNDNFGHPAGDRVIKSLARLLKKRLRENDLVGRYGGEEFAVVLVDTNRTAAKMLLDSIRNDFSKLRHLADGHEFVVTFSCGVADVTDYCDATKLAGAADMALYKAKEAGRNQVVISHPQTSD